MGSLLNILKIKVNLLNRRTILCLDFVLFLPHIIPCFKLFVISWFLPRHSPEHVEGATAGRD